MDDVTRHPDDATLFDLVEDALEPARADQVRAHLARCAACAAFVQAARAGAPVTSSAVEPMPADAAAALMGAVTTAWRERVSGIAAAEAAQDAAAPEASTIDTTPVPVPAPTREGSFAGYAPGATTDHAAGQGVAGSTPRAATPRRRGRRLVPVLAFVVLGTLAGTSIYIGNESSDDTSSQLQRDGGAESADEATTGAATDGDVASGEVPSASTVQEPAFATPASEPDATGASGSAQAGGAPADPAVGAPVDDLGVPIEPETGAAKADRSAAEGAATATDSTVPPPADYDEFVDQEPVCIATLDEAQLALPDGRIPTQITQGPFGFYLVCG